MNISAGHIDKRKIVCLVSALIATTAVAGCSGSSKGLEGPADTVAIFQQNTCISCHGSELQGRMGEATNLQKVGARMTKAQIAAQIRNGGGSMPAFGSRLSAEEIDKLASWLAGKK